jgi:hypothetical protein
MAIVQTKKFIMHGDVHLGWIETNANIILS